MPTYNYKCDACERIFEAQQSIHDAPLTECEKCGGKLKKVIGQVSVTFKGAGFYRTDNAPKGD